MKRDYETGVAEDVRFFTGYEVEKTPAYGMHTLFVTGLNDPGVIKEQIKNQAHQDDDIAFGGEIRHIFFGANHSFRPHERKSSAYDYYNEWDKMIEVFLNEGYWCSLDIPITAAEEFLDGPLVEYENFIPQLRVPVPYVKQWNYNTMLKIDDKDFKATNPGVWCHSLHDLLDREKFTDWTKYTLDKPVE